MRLQHELISMLSKSSRLHQDLFKMFHNLVVRVRPFYINGTPLRSKSANNPDSPRLLLTWGLIRGSRALPWTTVQIGRAAKHLALVHWQPLNLPLRLRKLFSHWYLLPKKFYLWQLPLGSKASTVPQNPATSADVLVSTVFALQCVEVFCPHGRPDSIL